MKATPQVGRRKPRATGATAGAARGARTAKPPRRKRPVLAQHRHTLLEEARNLIEERGLKGFGIRALSARSGIGHRTIYMLYGSKEELIAAALQEYMEETRAKFVQSEQFETIGGMLKILETGAEVRRAIRNYMRAIDTLYFSLPDSPRFHGVVRAARRSKFEQWINASMRAGILKAWVDPEMAAEDQLRAEIILTHDWCAGTLKDDEYDFRRKRSFLLLALAIVESPHDARIERALIDLTRQHSAAR